MRRTIVVLTAAALVLGAVVACRREPAGIAVVGGRTVPAERYQRWLQRQAGMPWQAVGEAVAGELLDQFLDEEVVLAAARRRGLLRREPSPPRGAAVRDLLERLCGPPPTPAPEAVAAEVARRAASAPPERVRARQMVFRTLRAAREAQRRLAAGEAWERVSAELSVAPNADTGGGLGVLTRGQLPPEVEAALFDLAPGEVSRPVRGPGGYHIFEVLERVDPREALEAAARRDLAEAAASRHLAACVQRLAREVGVEVRADRLWFRYDGRYGEDRHGSSATDGGGGGGAGGGVGVGGRAAGAGGGDRPRQRPDRDPVGVP